MNIKELITRPNPVIFEIGCNDGSDTEKFVADFPDATIYCFEPDPETVKRFLERKLNVKLYQAAISDVTGFTTFSPSNNNGLSGSIVNPKIHLEVYPQVKFIAPIEVATYSLDDFVSAAGIDFIDFIWADVQGAEEKMIRGGMNTLTKKVKYLFTEFSNVELYEGAPTLPRILELLPSFELVEVPWQWWADGNCLLRNKNL